MTTFVFAVLAFAATLGVGVTYIHQTNNPTVKQQTVSDPPEVCPPICAK